MIDAQIEVVRWERSQLNQATAILAKAFYDDPMFRYFIPETEPAKLNALNWFCEIILNYSQPYNQIYTTAGDLKGIAAWIPPGHSPLSTLRLLQLGLYALPFKLGWKKAGRFLSLFSMIDEHHSHDIPQPHWYLFMLGVAPNYQNQGIGSLLLQPVLKQADSEGLPCYLETSTESAVRFYQRHGFAVLWQGKVPGGNSYLWTMKREPN